VISHSGGNLREATLLLVCFSAFAPALNQDRLPPHPENPGTYVLHNHYWQRLYIESAVGAFYHDVPMSLQTFAQSTTSMDIAPG
jgi:hypothetical protein